MGKSTINGRPFSIAMLNYQRVHSSCLQSTYLGRFEAENVRSWWILDLKSPYVQFDTFWMFLFPQKCRWISSVGYLEDLLNFCESVIYSERFRWTSIVARLQVVFLSTTSYFICQPKMSPTTYRSCRWKSRRCCVALLQDQSATEAESRLRFRQRLWGHLQLSDDGGIKMIPKMTNEIEEIDDDEFLEHSSFW